MAIIGTIRKHSGLTVGLVVSGLILFLVGGDLFQLSLSGRRSTHVGTIAGTKVALRTYQSRLEALRRTLPAQAHHPQWQALLRDKAWEQLISQRTYQQACDALGLAVSEEELVDMVQGQHMHPELQIAFTDPNTGVFDKKQLISYLQNLGQMPSAQQMQWRYFEQELATARRHDKLTRLMEQSAGLSDWTATPQQHWAQTALHVRYLYIPYHTCQDTPEALSDAVLQKYLSAHQQAYQVPESRTVQWVPFRVVPTEAEVTLLEATLVTMKQAFAQAADAQAFAKSHTEGDVALSYSSFTREQLPAALAQQPGRLKQGQVVGPVQEGSWYKLYKVAAIRTAPTRQYEVAIIEKQLMPGDQARDQAFRKAHQCADSAKNATQLEAYATQEGLPCHTAAVGPNDEQVGVLPSARELVRWLYNEAKLHQVSPVFELGDDYVVAAMTQHVQKGVAPLAQVWDEIALKLHNDYKAQRIIAQLEALSGDTLAAKAAAYGSDARVIEMESLRWSDNTLDGVGMATQAIGAAFGLQPGAQTTVADEHGVLCIELVKQQPPTAEALALYQQQQRQEARLQQAEATAQALKALAKVKDNRHRFY